MSDDGWNKVENEFWNPEKEGDHIQGVYVDKKLEVGKHKSNVYVVKQEGGKLINAFGSTVLDDSMIGVEKGQQVKIVYKGMVKGSNAEYKDYDVLTKPLSEE